MSDIAIIGTILSFAAMNYFLGFCIASRQHLRFERDLVNHNEELLNELYRAVKHIARLSKKEREDGDEWKDGQ